MFKESIQENIMFTNCIIITFKKKIRFYLWECDMKFRILRLNIEISDLNTSYEMFL